MASQGSIEYDIAVDTASMLKAESVINRSLTKISSDFDRADSAVNKFIKTQASLGNKINGLNQVIDKNGNVLKSATIEYRKLSDSAESSFNKLRTSATKSSKAVRTGLDSLGRGAGQAGIQIQQFIGQVQGGQSALLALSQQGADLGIVLGAPLLGAAIGITTSAIGILINSLGFGKDKMAELDKATEDLGRTLTEASSGTDVLSDKILKLAKRSESLARVEISKGIVTSEKIIEDSIKAINENAGLVGDGFSKAFDRVRIKSGQTFDDIAKSSESLVRVSGELFNNQDILKLDEQTLRLQSTYDLTRGQAIRLGVAVSNVATDKSILSAKALENTISELNDETGGASTKFVNLAAKLVPLFTNITDGVDKTNLLRQAFFDLGKAVDESEKEGSKYSDTAIRITQSIESQILALKDGEEAAFRFATAQQLGLEVGEMIPSNIDEQISALFRLKKAQEDATKSKRAADNADREKVTLGRQTETLGLSPLAALQSRQAKELELLRQANEQKLIIDSEYLTRKAELEQQHADQTAELNERTSKNQIINYKELKTQIAGTFASVALGAQSGEDAVRSLARSILTKLLGSVIQYGIKSIASNATVTNTQVANNAAIAASAAPAAALTTAATGGANIPFAIAGLTAISLAAAGIAGRQYGGPVSGGTPYRVGEAGPEIFSSGGRNYMIPGQDGKVIPNHEVGSGGQSNTSVTFNMTVSDNTPEKFREMLVQQSQVVTNLVEKSINDRGRNL